MKAHVAPLREQIATLKATAEARHRLHINTHEALELQASRVDMLEREAEAAAEATTEAILDAVQLRERIRELTKVVATNEGCVNTLFKHGAPAAVITELQTAPLRERVAQLEAASHIAKEEHLVGRCRLTVSQPVLKAPMVSALETKV